MRLLQLADDTKTRPIGSEAELVQYFAAAAKPREDWLVGTEHEMHGVYTTPEDLGTAPPYEGDRGIRAILDDLGRDEGWSPIIDAGNVIALAGGDAQITIEPGGQLEHAGRPVRDASELEADLREYLARVAEPSERYGLAWLGVGFRPFGAIDDVPWMPKSRYVVMRDYLPSRGKLAHEMMKRTATVQVNLDFGDGHDAREKLYCVMSVTSLLTAIYANSPVVDGQVSEFSTYRGEVWRYMDPDRCGILPFVFEDGCDDHVCMFERYTSWAVDVPMFFVYRDGYLPARGTTFRQFMVEGFEGHRATMADWELHLSTLFPEARLKKFLEIRGCDAGSIGTILALGPLCRGLLYDDTARAAAVALTSELEFSQRLELQEQVARLGLGARIPGSGRSVLELSKELVAIARDGLGRVHPDELPYLEPLQEIVETGRTQADAVVDLWQSEPDLAKRIEALAYPMT